MNPTDPYFTNSGQNFDPKVQGLYQTEGIITVMKQYDPRKFDNSNDRASLRKTSALDIRRRSAAVMKSVCDKDS